MRLARAAVTGLLLTILACQDGATGPAAAGLAGSPSARVNGTDVAQPVVQRITAVTNVVRKVNTRAAAAMVAFPPNPCAEINPACTAAFATLSAYAALGQGVADVCAGGLPTGVAPNPDGALAPTTSAGGAAGQLGAIAAVLGNATNRFTNIFLPDPGPPDLPWLPNPGPPDAPTAAALNALSVAVHTGGSAVAGWLGESFDYPPNPCAERG